MVTATLIGVGVAGATGDAALSHPRADAGASGPALSHALPAAAAGALAAGTGPAGPVDAAYHPRHSSTPAGTATRAAPGYVPARQRIRPTPPPQWVNPLPEAQVTSCFGQRWGRLHAGVDLAAPDGTRIRAAGAGTVVAAGVESGYGIAVLIDHGNGYLTHYGHMSAVTVQAGQPVAAGAQIGNEGSTGHSTGPHLHFEVHQGAYKNPIEPTRWMHDHGVDIPGCALTHGRLKVRSSRSGRAAAPTTSPWSPKSICARAPGPCPSTTTTRPRPYRW